MDGIDKVVGVFDVRRELCDKGLEKIVNEFGNSFGRGTAS